MLKVYEFSGKHPLFCLSHFKQVKGKNIFQKISVKSVILGVQINAFCAMSERSFYYGEIIKTSKTRMGFLHKSRNRQTNIQQPLPKMHKQMQAKLQSGCCRLSEL